MHGAFNARTNESGRLAAARRWGILCSTLAKLPPQANGVLATSKAGFETFRVGLRPQFCCSSDHRRLNLADLRPAKDSLRRDAASLGNLSGGDKHRYFGLGSARHQGILFNVPTKGQTQKVE
jgi:hypothetical protein